MARSSKVELCMICEDVPCSCFAKPKRSSVPRQVQPKAQIEPTPIKSSGAQLAIQQQLSKQKHDSFAKRFLTPLRHRTKVTVDPTDAMLSEALKALEPIMAPSEREKYRVLLTSTPSLDERAASWRARREHHD